MPSALDQIVDRFKAALSDRDRLISVLLYGSGATGDEEKGYTRREFQTSTDCLAIAQAAVLGNRQLLSRLLAGSVSTFSRASAPRRHASTSLQLELIFFRGADHRFLWSAKQRSSRKLEPLILHGVEEPLAIREVIANAAARVAVAGLYDAGPSGRSPMRKPVYKDKEGHQ